jgi:hypothetical protein
LRQAKTNGRELGKAKTSAGEHPAIHLSNYPFSQEDDDEEYDNEDDFNAF